MIARGARPAARRGPQGEDTHGLSLGPCTTRMEGSGSLVVAGTLQFSLPASAGNSIPVPTVAINTQSSIWQQKGKACPSPWHHITLHQPVSTLKWGSETGWKDVANAIVYNLANYVMNEYPQAQKEKDIYFVSYRGTFKGPIFCCIKDFEATLGYLDLIFL